MVLLCLCQGQNQYESYPVRGVIIYSLTYFWTLIWVTLLNKCCSTNESLVWKFIVCLYKHAEKCRKISNKPEKGKETWNLLEEFVVDIIIISLINYRTTCNEGIMYVVN